MHTAVLADLGEFITGTAGTIAWNLCVFVAGALMGAPLWNWLKKLLPWSK